MTLFAFELYSLITNPIHYITHHIENKESLFPTFNLFFLLVVSGCQYVGFLSLSQYGSILSVFSYIMLFLFYALFFILLIFFESAVTSFFLKNRNVTPFPFGGLEVFSLVSLSYFPYLFLPGASIISQSLGAGLYSLFVFVLFIYMLVVRKRLLSYYSNYFTLSPIMLTLLPTFLPIVLGFLILLFIGSTVILSVIYELNHFIDKVFKAIPF